MLSIEKLNTEDLYIIKSIPKSFKSSLILGSIVYVPLSFLIGLIGLTKKGKGYWQTTILFLLFFIVAFLLFMVKEYVAYKKDLKWKLKLVGHVRITEKIVEKDKTLIHTDAKDLKEFKIYSKESSDKIEIGDILTIQISKYSKPLLTLEKDGVDLLNCN